MAEDLMQHVARVFDEREEQGGRVLSRGSAQ